MTWSRPYTQESYQEYLTSPHWQRLRSMYHGRPCYWCNHGDYRSELHHISYDHLYREKINVDIFPLCRKHHQQANFYWGKWKVPYKHLKRWFWIRTAVYGLTTGFLGKVADGIIYAILNI